MKISIDWIDQLGFSADIRHFKNLLMDEPASFKGSDRGPSPVEYLLTGIGGCLGASFIYCCKINELKIKSLNIVVDGTLTHKGPYNLLQLDHIDVELNVNEIEEKYKKKLDKCIGLFESYCVISNTLSTGLSIATTVNY